MTYDNNTHGSDQVDGEITAAFATGNPAELPRSHAAELEFEQLPNGSAAVVVKRGPNAGSRFTMELVSICGPPSSQRHLPRRHHRQPPPCRIPL
jgi:hypothetical protein